MEKLSIALVQADTVWEDPERNRELLDEMMDDLKENIDLIVLPEMFTTGFSMHSREMAEEMVGPTLEWMRKRAAGLQCVVTGSLIIREGGSFFNRLIWMPPDGSVQWYDKRHLFRMGNENHSYNAGAQKLITSLKGWRICPLICYDLRFPVWSRNQNDTDMIIYVANWPASRRRVWNILLKARAIENQVFVVGVNRVGKDGEGINYAGDSCLINPRGEVAEGFDRSYPGVTIADADPGDLLSFRKKFPVGDDADDFTIQP